MKQVLRHTEPGRNDATGVPVTDQGNREWLLFMAQLPAEPSSARVAMWRRLKSAGATSLLTGTWVLPAGEDHAVMLGQLADTVRGQGGSAVLFIGRQVDGMTAEDVVERFRADRAREYDEFVTRGDGLLAGIAKETAASKFGFAELEETEDDLEKMTAWLGKIEARDFFPDGRRNRAKATLETCREAMRRFAETTYDRQGAVEAPADHSRPRVALQHRRSLRRHGRLREPHVGEPGSVRQAIRSRRLPGAVGARSNGRSSALDSEPHRLRSGNPPHATSITLRVLSGRSAGARDQRGPCRQRSRGQGGGHRCQAAVGAALP